MEKPLHAGPDALPEERLVLTLDNKDKITEACASCVVHGKIDNTVSFPVDRLHLLEPPNRLPIPAAMMTSFGACFCIGTPPASYCLYGIGFPGRLQAPFTGNFASDTNGLQNALRCGTLC